MLAVRRALPPSSSQCVARVPAAAAITPGATHGDAENTAIAQGNTRSAEVKRSGRRDLTLKSLEHAVSVGRHGNCSAHRTTSGIARKAHENSNVVGTQRATVSEDMDMISIDKLTISVTKPSVSDDMDIISMDMQAGSVTELTGSDDMDMISIDELAVSEYMDMIRTDELAVSATDMTVSEYMNMISTD